MSSVAHDVRRSDTVPSWLKPAGRYLCTDDDTPTRGVRTAMTVNLSTNSTTVLLVVTKTVTLILGALITFLAYRAFRRQGAPALKALMIGFGLVTVGSVLGGALYHAADVGFALGVGIESLVTAAGFGVLVYSLYVGVDDTGDSRSPSRQTVTERDGRRRGAD